MNLTASRSSLLWNVWMPLVIGGSALAAIISLQLPTIRSTGQATDPNQTRIRREQYVRTVSSLGSIGLQNVAADLLWLDFIQYFGGVILGQEADYKQSKLYLDTITDLDPQFLEPYLFATFAYAWKQGRPEEAIKLLQKGTESITPDQNPLAYRLWYQIALVQTLWLGNMSAGRDAFFTAADWLERIPADQRERYQIKFSGEQFRAWGKAFQTNPRSAQVRYDIWVQILEGNADKEIQKLALTQIQALGGLKRNPDGTFKLERPAADAQIQ